MKTIDLQNVTRRITAEQTGTAHTTMKKFVLGFEFVNSVTATCQFSKNGPKFEAIKVKDCWYLTGNVL